MWFKNAFDQRTEIESSGPYPHVFFSFSVSWIKEERATDIFLVVTSTGFIIVPFFLIKIDKGHN